MADENGKDLIDDAAESAGDAAENIVDKGKEMAGESVDKGKEIAGDPADAVKDAADAVGDKAGEAASAVTGAAGGAADKVGDTLGGVTDASDGDGDSSSVLQWLLPLLLLGLLLVLFFMFCSKKPADVPAANTNEANSAGNETTGVATESSVNLVAKDGKYAISGVVKDDETKANILKEAEAVWGAGNVDVSGLSVDAKANPLIDGWWDGFKGLLPDLKGWTNGTISWSKGEVTTIGEIPGEIGAKIKSLFAGWTLPMSIEGEEGAAKAANEKAVELLASADTAEKVVEVLNTSIINFASGSSAVPEDAKPIIEKAAQALKNLPESTVIEIGGHTDNVGNADSNMKLSSDRAESVRKALVDLGVNDKMLTAKGYGSTVEKADNTTDEGRFRNRRIEYKVGGTAAAPAADDGKPAGEPKAGTPEAN